MYQLKICETCNTNPCQCSLEYWIKQAKWNESIRLLQQEQLDLFSSALITIHMGIKKDITTKNGTTLHSIIFDAFSKARIIEDKIMDINIKDFNIK